jgi:hypothetical protein
MTANPFNFRFYETDRAPDWGLCSATTTLAGSDNHLVRWI